MNAMERVAYDSAVQVEVEGGLNITAVGKPPWSYRAHSGRLERLILQLGRGKGRFFEVTGIPRSIGCIGNNRFILRREPLSVERMKELIREFRARKGKEIYLTNYDSVDYLMRMANYAASIGIPEVYAVVRIEDMDRVVPLDDVRVIVELEYSGENLRKLGEYGWAYGALIMATYRQFEELERSGLSFPGEIYVDVLYPGSFRKVDFNTIELKRTLNPTNSKYHDCLAGTLAITADGYALPCPLLRNFVIGDVREASIKNLMRKKRLKSFWKLTKDGIEVCRSCPFKYICHDCRALEYRGSGDPFGVEFCPLEL
ncbi:SPASM domain-containing protein [Thermococcus sp.]